MNQDRFRDYVKLVVDKTRAQWLTSANGCTDVDSSPAVSLVGRTALSQVDRQETKSKARQSMARAYGQQKR
jgi:hypothetical protein